MEAVARLPWEALTGDAVTVNQVNAVDHRTAMTTFGERMRALMDERGMSLRSVAEIVHYDKSYLSKVINGHKPVTPKFAKAVDDALDAAGELADLAPHSDGLGDADPEDDEINALELDRRATASDVGAETLERLELAVDDPDLAAREPAMRKHDLGAVAVLDELDPFPVGYAPRSELERAD